MLRQESTQRMRHRGGAEILLPQEHAPSPMYPTRSALPIEYKMFRRGNRAGVHCNALQQKGLGDSKGERRVTRERDYTPLAGSFVSFLPEQERHPPEATVRITRLLCFRYGNGHHDLALRFLPLGNGGDAGEPKPGERLIQTCEKSTDVRFSRRFFF